MAGIQLPRLFSGLWQLSSPAWGIAPRSKIMQQFSKHVESGLTAFDMADHYGDAEILFVSFSLGPYQV
jgi:aryl-alcohol dehydrogenase-like predicted oxidoreductase